MAPKSPTRSLPQKALRGAVAFAVALLLLLLLTRILFRGTSTQRQLSPEGRLLFTAERTHNLLEDRAVLARKKPPLTWTCSYWFTQRYEDLMSWNANPWHRPRRTFGSLATTSGAPLDPARAAEIQQTTQAWFQQVLARYPEFEIKFRNVSPENNGFLQWLELQERRAAASSSGVAEWNLPKWASDHLDHQEPLDREVARLWLTENAPLIQEIRSIGLLPDQSCAGIDRNRWFIIEARFARSACQALLLDARLAAEEGRSADALRSAQAARGISHHLANIESPTLLNETIAILLNQGRERYILEQIFPALPPGEKDPRRWEALTFIPPAPPSRFAQLMRSEWNLSTQQFLLPMLAHQDDPFYPPDPADLLDSHALTTLQIMENFRSDHMNDWASAPPSGWPPPDFSHLSATSNQIASLFFLGIETWRKGMARAQSAAALHQAAWALLRGEPLPNDPIFDQPYRWDPETRELQAPDTDEFREMNLLPVTVPTP
ncbi:hypothetical protein HNR46_001884 [Haloferula luteola]|uniref:Uncharacterized protein n=1 Tax=Haloferula luteola TaxID=595692 RepID=A0A840V0X6_9BACT|nr:hypothetical protein [Haloferula luteola]MBB5351645.1 hypothetical protein [Haloferula luteola]